MQKNKLIKCLVYFKLPGQKKKKPNDTTATKKQGDSRGLASKEVTVRMAAKRKSP